MTDENNDDRPVYQAACHCGTVRFSLRLTDGLRTARRCNCSLCRMRGAVAVSANLSDITVIQGEESLTLYQFNTRELSTTSAPNVASTPFTSAALSQTSTGSTWPVLRA